MKPVPHKSKTLYTGLMWLSFVVLAGVILLYGLLPAPDASVRLESIPLNGYNFSGIEIPLTIEEKTYLGEATAIKRLYQMNNGKSLMLLVVDGAKDRHVIHNPAFCLVGAGQEIKSEVDFPLLRGNGKVSEIANGDDFQEMAFWYTNGKDRHTSFAKFLWQSILSRLTLGYLAQAPVMIIVYTPMHVDTEWGGISDQLPFLMEL